MKKTNVAMHRHHKNPLLKECCPNIYGQYRSNDICLMSASEHSKYHIALSKDRRFQQLLAEAYEIASDWVFGEEALANKLDALWNEHDMP